MSDVVVRFCPSPTGTPHVGMVRTALFNWAYARHTGGKLVFRIEDTDAARDSEESYAAIVESLRWLGLNWDEGIDPVGGPHGPYRQSQRKEIYARVLEQLKQAGYVYPAYSTPQEVEQRHRDAGRDPKLGYDNFDRDLSPEQIAQYEAEGRQPVWRFRMPHKVWEWDDLVRGHVTFQPETQPDYVVARSNGEPLYTLVNPVDDAMMGITHVLRGEDLLASTPRQLALYEALVDLGIATVTPVFAHLPFVMGEGNKKLSKRDPQSNLFNHRDAGIIPEGMLNYLSLLGWSLSKDRDIFGTQELIENFDVASVLSNPARFDQKKLEAINAEHIRLLEPADFAARLREYMEHYNQWPKDYPADKFAIAADLVQTRIKMLKDAWGLLKFLVISEQDFAIDEKAGRKNLKEDAVEVLQAAIEALDAVPEDGFVTAAIEQALTQRLIEGMELKPRKAFGAVRVATAGEAVSPPLFESLELLGKERTISRLKKALELTPWVASEE